MKPLPKHITMRKQKFTDFVHFMKANKSLEYRMCFGASKNSKPASVFTIIKNLVKKSFDQTKLGFVLILNNDTVVGHVRLSGIDTKNKHASLGIGIMQNYWNKGYGTAAIKLLLHFAFNELQLNRVRLRVLTHNKRAIACYKKCGFKIDGELKDIEIIDGKFVSDFLMSVSAKEYKAL